MSSDSTIVPDCDLIKGEIEMLDGMISEVEDQLAQVGSNLRKLRVVRDALKQVAGDQPELDLDA